MENVLFCFYSKEKVKLNKAEDKKSVSIITGCKILKI